MKTCATTAHRQKWWFLLLSVLVARATCIWLFCKRMTNRAGELHRRYEPKGHISNLSSLLYGTRTKLFHIGFISFRGLKYTTHDRFRGNFPYEWGSSKSRTLKEGSRLPRHSKIPLKSLMRWSRTPFLSSNILQNYKTSVFWRDYIKRNGLLISIISGNKTWQGSLQALSRFNNKLLSSFFSVLRWDYTDMNNSVF